MTLSLLTSLLNPLSYRWPLLLYASTWTAILTAVVAVASFSPEMAFVSAISPGSSFSRPCAESGEIRVPLDVPSMVFCLPAHVFAKSKMDILVPPLFAALVVAGSACAVKAFGLWEVEDEESHN